MSLYAAGITNIDSNGAVIIPPTIGAAMRLITSEPVPWPQKIGSKPYWLVGHVGNQHWIGRISDHSVGDSLHDTYSIVPAADRTRYSVT